MPKQNSQCSSEYFCCPVIFGHQTHQTRYQSLDFLAFLVHICLTQISRFSWSLHLSPSQSVWKKKFYLRYDSKLFSVLSLFLFNEVSVDLPSIYYQSCTSREQCLVSYRYKKHYGFYKTGLQIFNKQINCGDWDG